MHVTFQGERGAFSELAARSAFPQARLQGLPRLRDVAESLASGDADRIVLPVETSGVGLVQEAIPELVRLADNGRASIVAERWERVQPVLLGTAEASLDSVTSILSHPRALEEAKELLSKHFPHARLEAWDDSAGAARHLATSGASDTAVIASPEAGELYGLQRLDSDFAESLGWHTRFVFLGPAGTSVEGANRSTLLLTPSPQAPNALFRTLTAFVGRRLALFRLDQLPRPGQPGQYRYLLDVEGDAASEPLAAAISDARAFCDRIVVVGSYIGSQPD